MPEGVGYDPLDLLLSAYGQQQPRGIFNSGLEAVTDTGVVLTGPGLPSREPGEAGYTPVQGAQSPMDLLNYLMNDAMIAQALLRNQPEMFAEFAPMVASGQFPPDLLIQALHRLQVRQGSEPPVQTPSQTQPQGPMDLAVARNEQMRELGRQFAREALSGYTEGSGYDLLMEGNKNFVVPHKGRHKARKVELPDREGGYGKEDIDAFARGLLEDETAQRAVAGQPDPSTGRGK